MTDEVCEVWKEYEGKRVYIELRNKRVYSGFVKSVEGDFMILFDKFENLVTIRYEHIVSIEEQPIKNMTDGRYGNKV